MTVDIRVGDCRTLLAAMEPQSVQCCVTSPPYFGLRDYGMDGQIGLEQTPNEYVAEMVAVFRDVRRVLRDDGTAWLNLGDSYANDTKWGGSTSGKHVRANHGDTGIGRRRQNTGLKSKDLIGIPWRVAFALHADGWYLRQDIIWSKPNPMPESVRDRCTKAHEYIFMLSKSARYYYDADAIKEDAAGVPDGGRMHAGTKSFQTQSGGKTSTTLGRASLAKRNRRSVWTVSTKPFKGAHFATFPPDLIEPCILAGCPTGGTILDPFGGAGTTGLVAKAHGRNAILLELNPEYAAMARERIDAPVKPKKARKTPANDNKTPDLFAGAA